jgi:NAD(P)-dependent dehydrogenase (short-subunit alcohol dehydrogenase family)
MKTVLITGANRGIGLALVQLYVSLDYHVIATCRHPADANELNHIATTHPAVQVESLDVTDENQIKALADKVNQPIDILLLNAGIMTKRVHIRDLQADDMQRIFMTNTVAQLMMVKWFHPLVKESQEKLIVAMTSRMGSIADNESGSAFAYRASKAALNASMKSVGIDLKDDGIHVTLVHPGWVKTRMGGENAPLDADECSKRIEHIINTAREHDTASFRSHDGTVLPW